MNFSEAFRTVRLEKKMTQVAAAKKAKLSQTTLSQIESGNKNPSRATIKKLAKAYGVPELVLVVLAVEEKDVQKDKRPIYKELKGVIDSLVKEIIKA